MVDVQRAAEQISELSLLKYFPQDQFAQAALLRMVCEKAKSNEQIAWLVSRVLELYEDWPGPRAVLELFKSPMMPGNMKPLSEADRLKVTGGDTLLIGDGSIPDPTLEADVRVVLSVSAKTKAAISGFSDKTTAEEIESAPDWLRKLEGYE